MSRSNSSKFKIAIVRRYFVRIFRVIKAKKTSNIAYFVTKKVSDEFFIAGIIQQFELSQSSVMQKLWTGLVPSVMRLVVFVYRISLLVCHQLRRSLRGILLFSIQSRMVRDRILKFYVMNKED